MEALADKHAQQMLQSHAIRGLWPLWPMLAFDTVEWTRSTLRFQMWQTLEKRYIQWRISSIFDVLVADWVKFRNAQVMGVGLTNMRLTNIRLYEDSVFFDMFVDLLEFSG